MLFFLNFSMGESGGFAGNLPDSQKNLKKGIYMGVKTWYKFFRKKT